MLFLLEVAFAQPYNSFFKWLKKNSTTKIEIIHGSDHTSAALTTFSNGTLVAEQSLPVPPDERLEVYKVQKKKTTSGQNFALRFVRLDIWKFFEQFGLIYAGVIICIFVWEYDPQRRKYIIVLLLSLLITGVIVWLIKHTTGRIRPGLTDGTIVFVPISKAWKMADQVCFPSGHTTCAFVVATFLTCMYPRMRWLFYGIAACAGFSRVVFQAHWLTDVYAGALLGHYGTLYIYRHFPALESLLRRSLPKPFRQALYLEEPPGLSPGQAAPLFSNASCDDADISLADFRGSWVVLSFFTRAFSPGCQNQIASIERNYSAITQKNAAVIAVSSDSAKTLNAFSAKHHISFPLISDTELRIARRYHVSSLDGMHIRPRTFIIDPDGNVAHIIQSVNPVDHGNEIYGILLATQE